MLKGPRGERRPADAIGRAVMVARIATGETEDTRQPTNPKRARGGRAGGVARKAVLSSERRTEIGRAAAAARWG